MMREDYLDEEITEVEPFEGPSIRFSHIEADNEGLRGYQCDMKHDIYDKWDYMTNVMLQMPTGTGKTVVFASIVKDILRWCRENSPESKILVIAHRKELIRQAAKKMKFASPGIIRNGEPMDLSRPVQVASIQTFMSRRNYETMRRQRFDFIIIDEAHHSMASGYQKLWEMFPNSKKLGVTATPWRMNHSGFTELFDDMVLSYSIEWFVEHGYLSNYDYVSIKRNSSIQHEINDIQRFGVDGDYLESELSERFDTDHIRAQLYGSFEKYARTRKGIIYAIDRKHASNIRDLYASHGVPICMIDGTTPAKERDDMIDDFKAGRIQVIVNVNIFSEGFDCPNIEFIQLARPTRSLAMYLQQVGRGLRISDDKTESIILDNVGLYNRFGTPMANRHWRYHFQGSKDTDSDSWNDGTGANKDIIRDEFERDYSEGNEEMTVVEHAVSGQQVRPDMANSSDSGISDCNVFKKNGLYGICDRRGRTLVPPIYEEMRQPFYGYIPFRQNGLWGIMLRNGTIKVKPKYFYIGPYDDGVVAVQNTEDSPVYYINGKLERVK